MNRTRPTVADMLALKGKRQITMLFVDQVEEAAAASAAGIDMLSIISPGVDAARCARRRATVSCRSG